MPPPVAVSMVLSPAQMERFPEILAVGESLTVIDLLAVLLHPVTVLVTVTLYVPWFGNNITFGIEGF